MLLPGCYQVNNTTYTNITKLPPNITFTLMLYPFLFKVDSENVEIYYSDCSLSIPWTWLENDTDN